MSDSWREWGEMTDAAIIQRNTRKMDAKARQSDMAANRSRMVDADYVLRWVYQQTPENIPASIQERAARALAFPVKATDSVEDKFPTTPAEVAVNELEECRQLLERCYLALHRNEWEDGETESELSDRINDTMHSLFPAEWTKFQENLDSYIELERMFSI